MEANFFSQVEMRSELFNRKNRDGIALDLDHFLSGTMGQCMYIVNVERREYYMRLFREVQDEKAIIEASASAMFALQPPRSSLRYSRMHIVIDLHNPIECTQSHYLMNLWLGKSPVADSIHEGSRSITGTQTKTGQVRRELYLSLGLYSGQVQRYIAYSCGA